MPGPTFGFIWLALGLLLVAQAYFAERGVGARGLRASRMGRNVYWFLAAFSLLMGLAQILKSLMILRVGLSVGIAFLIYTIVNLPRVFRETRPSEAANASRAALSA